MPELPAEIFKAYDIRGIVGKSLTPPIVRSIGQALGTLAQERGRDTMVTARDGRISGPELCSAVADGIQSSGANVIDIGAVTTPMSYFAAHELETQCSVMITGSHNPPDYNGLKMVVAGDTLAGDDIQALKTRIEAGALKTGAGGYRSADIAAAYLDRVARDVALARPMKIAVDCGNGIAGAFAPALFRRLGCDVTELFCEVDGTFPNHHPDPSQPKNLQDLIHKLWEFPSSPAERNRMLDEIRKLDFAAVIFLFPDPIGLGWGRTEKTIARLGIPNRYVLNGRKRFFEWRTGNRRKLMWRQFLEHSWVVETMLAVLAVIVSIPLAIYDGLLKKFGGAAE